MLNSFNSFSQKVQENFGDTVYIDMFSRFAQAYGLSDIHNSDVPTIVRYWNGGKLIAIEKDADTIYGCKVVYERGFRKSPSKRHKINPPRYFFEKYDLEQEDCLLVYGLTYLNPIDFNDYKNLLDSKERRDGGNATAIEIKDGEKYLIITGEFFSENQRDLVNTLVEYTELEDIEQEFNNDLPTGYWYNVGGTTSIRRISRLESLIYRLAFWRR